MPVRLSFTIRPTYASHLLAQNRIFIACTLLATLSLGFAFYFVNARATSEAEAELRRGLNEAGKLVDQNRVRVTDTFARLARLVADLPKLKAAVETGDPPTVQPLADEYRDQVKADILLLTGKRGELLGQSGAGAGELTVPAALKDARPLDEFSTFVPHSRGVCRSSASRSSLKGIRRTSSAASRSASSSMIGSRTKSSG